MPIQPDDRSASTASQVFSHAQVLSIAMEGLETLHLMLGETEALANCACNSLDDLPSSRKAHPTPSLAAPKAAPATTANDPGQAVNDPGQAVNDISQAVNNINQAINTADLDNIADLSELLQGLDDDLDEDPEGEDQFLAVGRVQTLVYAEGKAIRRSYRYCRRLRQYLDALIASVSRKAGPTPAAPPAGPSGAPLTTRPNPPARA